MSDPNNVEDSDLDYTRQMRRNLVESMIENGKLPTDPKDRTHFLMALDGMDRAALGKKRIEADKELGNAQVQAAGVLAELFKDSRTIHAGKGHRSEIPVLDESIAPTRVLPGELEARPAGDNYDSFMIRHQPVIDAGGAPTGASS